ncbi:OmpA family protein [Lewinella sp. W8]|uniref:OmpA family protein n=1 Tax=Lewinella sp. W8 TaxID=2528208 RepID=UPI001067F9C9|nr:OmpA family protein [Lewinella sp. W8]MTB53402.1 OmpA family protein [Lewinella sp. W8]
MQTFKNYFLVFLVAISLPFAQGCNTSKAVKGGAIGGAVGGVVGGAIGKKSGDGTKGVIIGSVIGGTAGAIIGKYMDKQAEEIEQIPGAEVERVGEGIMVTFDSGVLFGFDSYQLTDASKAEVRRMAEIFQRYPETDILVDGHTDSKGAEDYNQRLSEQRAAAVSDYLVVQGITRSRIQTVGHGEMQPVATNETEAGRAQNRRVEIAITANEELQEKAENGTLTVPE